MQISLSKPAKKDARKKQREDQDRLFQIVCREIDPSVEFEYRFHPHRKWRFDGAWLAYQVAVEIDGGYFVGGRHSRGTGQINDNEKINVAQSLGWRVYRFTPQQVKSGYFFKAMVEVMHGREVPGLKG
jgi:very-short-patch-repair endonuclease